MLTPKQLAAILGDETRIEILKLLSEKKLTTTELFKQLPAITRRESVFKSVKKLHQAGLVKRRFEPKTRAYRYFTSFKTIKIDHKLQITIK
jgi:DNA-binding transcriptional ArsR family regulator